MASYIKRKYDSYGKHEKPSKKFRSENVHTQSQGGKEQSLPVLPTIKPDLERAVFTHSSIARQHPDDPVMVNYERLEFLGDAQLEHIASLVIFDRYTSASPGKMSSLREALIRNETLSDFSTRYGFNPKLRIGGDQLHGKDKVKIMADVFEAYVAAIIASDEDPHRGFDTARKWLTELWEPQLAKLGMQKVDIDSKQDLAKKVLAKGVRLNYQEERAAIMHRSAGTKTFFMGVYLSGWGYENQHLGSGEGLSKKAAEQEAAAAALQNRYLMDDVVEQRKAYLERKNDASNDSEQQSDKLS